MATQAETVGLEARHRAANRLLRACVGAQRICFDPKVDETGNGLRALYGSCVDDALPGDMADLLKRLD
jgi:hypothetical protein